MPATPMSLEVTAADVALGEAGIHPLTDAEALAWLAEWKQANGFTSTPTMFGEDPDRLSVWNLNDLENMPPARWLIRNILEEKGMGIVYGDAGSGKTAVVLSMMWAWLAGKEFWLRPEFTIDSTVPVEERRVLYLLLEGREGIGPRFRSWLAAQKLGDATTQRVRDGFLVVPEAVALWKPNMVLDNFETWPASLRMLERTVASLEPQILVIDTLSRATPGMPENQAEQVSVLIDILTRFAQLYGATPILLHHQTKGDTGIIRGSSAIAGAVSSAVHISHNQRTGVRWLVPTKQRNTDLISKVPFMFIPQGEAFYVGDAPVDAYEPAEVEDFPLPVVGLSVKQVIEATGWSQATVYRKMKRWGYGTRGKGGLIVREDEPEAL
jgi:hypothetical protein